jgi:L-ascorbate metabolism protein UlaG (beta-lactamase superfamily)
MPRSGGQSVARMSGSTPVSVTLGGNATVLIRCGEVRVVTDPWLSQRCGPWRRLQPSAFNTSHLGEPRVGPRVALPASLDAVLISHAHPDHLDTASLAMLPRTTPVLTPAGHPFRKLVAAGLSNLHPLDPWGDWSVDGLRVSAVPSIHTRWSLGYVVAVGDQRIYFAGDAGPYTPFAEIAERCGPIDVALMPVGGSSLAIGRLQCHLTPKAAARATAAIRPRVVVPIHWGHVPCIPSTLDYFRGTAERFIQALRLHAPEIPVLSPVEGVSAEIPARSRWVT